MFQPAPVPELLVWAATIVTLTTAAWTARNSARQHIPRLLMWACAPRGLAILLITNLAVNSLILVMMIVRTVH